MASLCGTHIKPNRFNGRWRAKSRLKWNRQPPPTGTMWDTFQRLVKRAFCTKNMNRAKTLNIPLDTPLGSWYNIERHIEYDVYRSQNIMCKRPVEEGPSIFERYEIAGEANYFVQSGMRTTLVHASHPMSMSEGREGHYHPDHQYNIIDYPNEQRSPPMEGAKATLYLGMNMVTTEMAEQIHYAAEATQMLIHVQNLLRRTKETIEDINWRSIGRIKKRLKLHKSIRMTKMMYGWLNVGSQKVKMGQIGMCPCCGGDIETQRHLYTCPNVSMRQTIMESIKTAKSTLVRQGIPSSIYNEFVEQTCLAVNLENPDDTYSQDPELQNVRDQQSRLGEEAFMKGFLHKEWTRALNDRWTPAPPTEDGKKVHQKDALEQTVCLQRVLWEIFEAQWSCRNDILHGKESKTLTLDTEKKTNRLLEFHEKRNDLLRRCDHWMIDYPQDVIVKWSRSHKIRLLQNLERLKRIYDKEKIKDKDIAALRPITDFFQVVARTTPGAPVAPAAGPERCLRANSMPTKSTVGDI
eukprot:scaffold65096_cov24-Cyclotella_meneghiniana.AAC.6